KVVRSFDKTPRDYAYSNVELYYGNDMKFDKESDGSGNYTFKHQGKELYKFEAGDRKLSTLADIYAYSYEKGINFGNVELEFLINDSDEYIGKHFERPFAYKQRMKLEFERVADGAALFTDANYQNEVTRHVSNGFNVSVNQDTDAFLYATSIVNITTSTENKTVYVERKTEAKGHIAPVQKATFTVPTGITPATKDESPTQGRYYSITYRSPAITEQFIVYAGANVYYGGAQVTSDALKFTVNNVTRKISSIGIYSDENCSEDKSLSDESLLFGGFINKANKYSNTVYVKVAYENHQSSFTSFEGAELTLPSYLKLEGKTPVVDEATGAKTYTLLPGSYSTNNNYVEIHTCNLSLEKDEEVTDSKTVKVVASNHKDEKVVSFTADVYAGLKTLKVKNGENTVATITAGNTVKYSATFNLNNREDIKTLDLSFDYEAINNEGYALAYDQTGAGLKVTAPTAVNGFAVTNNIKSAQSALSIAITDDVNNVATGTQKFTVTFTDEYNGASTNNVFTLEIEITVTMDIYELAFADGTNTTVTVTGASSGVQTLTVSVVYNDGNTKTQPAADIIKTKDVLGVYVLNGTQYDAVNDGITVTRDASDDSGKTFKVQIENDIDRSQIYYLRLVYDNVTFNGDKHLRSILIKTLTSHIELDGANSIKPTQAEGEACPSASIVVQSADEEFTLVANVINDGSLTVENGKTVNYGLYTNFNCNTRASGITINNGVIKLTDPSAITGTVYYLAEYLETNTNQTYSLKVKLAYTVAPSAVKISGVDTKAFSAEDSTLTLYLSGASYTQADLLGKITADTAFTNALYGAENVVYGIELQNAEDRAYLDINGFVLTPKALNGNVTTTVPVVVTATYAGKEVEKVYNVLITPVADLALTQDSGTLNLLNRDSQLTVAPTVGAYNGFAPTYTLTAVDGLFAITAGSGNNKTVKLAANTKAKKGTYTLTANLTYAYSAVSNGGINAVGTFASSATYTVTVEGDYDLTFVLTSGGVAITPYNGTQATRYSVVDQTATFGISITSNDGDFDVTYGSEPVAPAVVTSASFNGTTAAVSLIPTA
ncbi:MAG: hypothetical protein K2O39_02070, partial [Clostridiales bacterium]|nr:hypothetical protein [Clostridiales bacterium]